MILIRGKTNILLILKQMMIPDHNLLAKQCIQKLCSLTFILTYCSVRLLRHLTQISNVSKQQQRAASHNVLRRNHSILFFFSTPTPWQEPWTVLKWRVMRADRTPLQIHSKCLMWRVLCVRHVCCCWCTETAGCFLNFPLDKVDKWKYSHHNPRSIYWVIKTKTKQKKELKTTATKNTLYLKLLFYISATFFGVCRGMCFSRVIWWHNDTG